VDVARPAGLAELELSALSQLTAVVGTQQGYVGPAFALMERAEQLARLLGREREATDFLFSRLIGHSQFLQMERGGRLLEVGGISADPVVRAHALHAWGWHQWEVGNIGEAFRYLNRSEQAFPGVERPGQNPLRRDIQLLRPGIQAVVTGMHGDLDSDGARFDAMEASAGDDAQLITLWAQFSVMLAGMTGDPAWALRVVERSALDPEHPYVYLDHYLRLAWCWARALTGHDAGSDAAEAEAVLTTGLLNPPMSGLTFNYGLLGEMFLAAGKPAEAARILDLADRSLEAYGQRYAEGLLLLLRARLLQARGAPAAEVRAVAERARALATEREAHLFARRAEYFLAEFSGKPARSQPLQ